MFVIASFYFRLFLSSEKVILLCITFNSESSKKVNFIAI